MDMNIGVILLLGAALGIRHAFDVDHLVAVSTIVSQYRNPFRSLWVGISWGLGHTTTLLLAGGAILLFKLSFFEDYSYIFEIAVGLMLVFLGLQVFWTLWRGRAHLHVHEHERETHWHIHPHRKTESHDHHTPSPWFGKLPSPFSGMALRANSYLARVLGRPFFRLKSYLVGTVHGLAGSAALMLLVLAALPSLETGILYIVVFGLGSTLAMGITTIFISMPFTLSGRLPTFNRALQIAAASFSIFLGVLLISAGR